MRIHANVRRFPEPHGLHIPSRALSSDMLFEVMSVYLLHIPSRFYSKIAVPDEIQSPNNRPVGNERLYE